MEYAIACCIGILTGIGVYLVLRHRLFEIIYGLTFLSYAGNLMLFSAGRPKMNQAPIVTNMKSIGLPMQFTDPMPQSLVLTAIVISFATTALSLTVAITLQSNKYLAMKKK